MNALHWSLIALAAGLAAGWGVASWRARRRERLRARLLSFVVHELNTPVSALNMTALNFLSGLFGEISQEQRPWIVLMREQVARLASMVGDLRDMIHLEFHRDLRLNPVETSVGDLIRESLAVMKEALARSEAEVDLRLPEDLPAVKADPDRLARVVTAILTHARKFRAKGPIVVIAEAVPRGVLVAVEYEGTKTASGRSEDALDLFYPARFPGSQVLASTGLGLGLPCRLVAAHGGKMTLDVDGEGRCRIAVRLPKHPVVPT
ncbi:MAG: HAMP domain-containing sensor histidine kinase [Elusimicrobiota bacterium]